MLRRLLVSFAAVVALLFVLVAPAAAQQRIALVIGNAAYPKGPIQHSLADGGLVAEALTSIGFEIVEGADVNSSDMRRLFGEFLARVNAAGPDTIAFIYYKGYAVQFEGDNYFIPVDAQLNRDSDIPIQGVRLFDLLRPLADTPAITKIVVLDAARQLPFQIQGGQLAPGLGAIEAAPGLLVAYSSAPGTIAPDGPGPYGPYATAIAEMVREPGLDIDTMFARIRLRTNETTQGAQTPWDVSQLQQVVMLVPGQPSAPPSGAQGFLAPPQTQVGAPVVRRRPPPRPIQEIGPEEAYAYAVEVDDLPTYVEYVRVYPNSPYAPRVWAMIRARREALVWREALLVNSPDAYWTYLERYPNGLYVFDARRRLRRLSGGDRPPPRRRLMGFAHLPPPRRAMNEIPPRPAAARGRAGGYDFGSSAGAAAAPLSRAPAVVHCGFAAAGRRRRWALAEAAAHVPYDRHAAFGSATRLPGTGPSSRCWRRDAAGDTSRSAARRERPATTRPAEDRQPAAGGDAARWSAACLARRPAPTGPAKDREPAAARAGSGTTRGGEGPAAARPAQDCQSAAARRASRG